MLTKLLIFVLVCYSVKLSSCAPAKEKSPEILYYVYKPTDNGYFYIYATTDGNFRQEIGTFLFKPNNQEPILHVTGRYTSQNSAGQRILVNYEAGEEGFRLINKDESFIDLRTSFEEDSPPPYYINSVLLESLIHQG